MNLAWNFPAHQTLSRPLASAARRRAATLAPVARCTFDPQPSFEPMTDWEEPVMTGSRTRAGSIEVDYQTELQQLVTRVFIQVRVW